MIERVLCKIVADPSPVPSGVHVVPLSTLDHRPCCVNPAMTVLPSGAVVRYEIAPHSDIPARFPVAVTHFPANGSTVCTTVLTGDVAEEVVDVAIVAIAVVDGTESNTTDGGDKTHAATKPVDETASTVRRTAIDTSSRPADAARHLLTMSSAHNSHIATPTAAKCSPPVAEMCPPGPVFGLWPSTLAQAVPVWAGAFGFGFGAAQAPPKVPSSPPRTVQHQPRPSSMWFPP